MYKFFVTCVAQNLIFFAVRFFYGLKNLMYANDFGSFIQTILMNSVICSVTDVVVRDLGANYRQRMTEYRPKDAYRMENIPRPLIF